MSPTRNQFEQACKRLLGDRYDFLVNDGRKPHDLCREIAQDVFVGVIDQADMNLEADLNVVRVVSKNLWCGEGVTGFAPES